MVGQTTHADMALFSSAGNREPEERLSSGINSYA
jgi:hypothetical protein